jgi:hypothetical protein
VAGTVSNNVVANGLLAVDGTKTNAIAATAAHVTNALGYIPVNKAGDTITGNLTVSGTINYQPAAGGIAVIVGSGVNGTLSRTAVTGPINGNGVATSAADITNVLGNYFLQMASVILPLNPNATPPSGTAAYIDTSSSDAKLVFSNTYVGRWQFQVPRDYRSNLVFDIIGNNQTATSGNDVIQARIWAMAPGSSASMGAESFDTANIVTVAAPGTARWPMLISITMTNNDAIAAGNWFMVELQDNSASAMGLWNMSSWTMNYTKQ